MKNKLLGSNLMGSKIVNLRNVLPANIIKTNMLIHENQICTLRGIIRTPKMPRYMQRDFTDEVIQGEFYLVVHIQKLDVFSCLEDRGDLSVFTTVEWGGISIKSKNVRSSLINETFHFNIPIPSDVKEDENRLIEFLSNDLKTKSLVRVNVWVDFGESNIDNIGTGYASLSYLYNVDSDEKIFKDTVQRK